MLCGPSAPIGLCTPINHPFVGLADTVDEEIPNNHLECIETAVNHLPLTGWMLVGFSNHLSKL